MFMHEHGLFRQSKSGDRMIFAGSCFVIWRFVSNMLQMKRRRHVEAS